MASFKEARNDEATHVMWCHVSDSTVLGSPSQDFPHLVRAERAVKKWPAGPR
jgi:hypothetical protein